MTLHIFFNNLSLCESEISHDDAVFMLKNFVSTIRSIKGIDPGCTLYSDININLLPLGSNNTISSLRNNSVCVEEGLFIKSLAHKYPLGSAFPENSALDYDYVLPADSPILPGKSALALGQSHAYDGICVSIPTIDFWEQNHLEIERHSLNSDVDLIIERVYSRNSTCPADVSNHEPSLRESLLPPFENGSQMWEARNALFPNLKFIPRVRQQVESILAGDPALNQIWIKLSGIDRAVLEWKNNGSDYPQFPFNHRPESKSRLAFTEFKDCDNYTRQFSLHTDYTPGEGRIHFILDHEPTRCALIGHIGKKLGIG